MKALKKVLVTTDDQKTDLEINLYGKYVHFVLRPHVGECHFGNTRHCSSRAEVVKALSDRGHSNAEELVDKAMKRLAEKVSA